MLKPQKALEREALLKRIRELDAQIAQHERNLLLGEARLPVDDQLRLKLRRFIETNIPELAGKIRVEVVSTDRQKNDHAELDQFRFSVAPLMELLKSPRQNNPSFCSKASISGLYHNSSLSRVEITSPDTRIRVSQEV